MLARSVESAMLQRASPTADWRETPASSGEGSASREAASREVERLEARRIGNLQSRSRRARLRAREEADDLRVRLKGHRQTRLVDGQQDMQLVVLYWSILLLLALACVFGYISFQLLMPALTPAPVPVVAAEPRHPLLPPRPRRADARRLPRARARG